MNDDFNNPDESPDPGDSQERNIHPTMSPIAAAFTGLVVVFVLYQIGGSILTLLIFGLDIKSANVNAMRLMTIGGQIMFILLPALIFAKLVYEDVGTIIRFKLPSFKEIIVFVVGMILITPLLQTYLYVQNFLINLLAEKYVVIERIKSILDQLDKLVTETYSDLLRSETVFEASFIVIVVAVVPSICEEVFFRGYVQKSFEFRIKPVWAALVTAIFFALYHFNPYGLIALFALGFFFGYSAYISGSIFIPLLLHFLNNFIAVMTYFILGEEEFIQADVSDPSQIGTNVFLFVFFLLLFIVYIFLVNRNYDKIKQRKELP